MANSKFNTRIQMKSDTEANWNLAVNFIPLAGEVIIYKEDSTYTYPRMKIGDGEKVVSALPFVTTSVNGQTGKVENLLTREEMEQYIEEAILGGEW